MMLIFELDCCVSQVNIVCYFKYSQIRKNIGVRLKL